jgi:hypothetical protein
LVLVIGEDEPLHEGEEKKPVKVLIAGSGLYASLVAYAVRKVRSWRTLVVCAST